MKERLRGKYKMDGKCWRWLGAISSRGYGSIRIHGQAVCAHRVYYMVYTGNVIPTDHDIHHVCGNKVCVNPAHLQPIPHRAHPTYRYRRAGVVRLEAVYS